jgi:hypothetical protein
MPYFYRLWDVIMNRNAAVPCVTTRTTGKKQEGKAASSKLMGHDAYWYFVDSLWAVILHFVEASQEPRSQIFDDAVNANT